LNCIENATQKLQETKTKAASRGTCIEAEKRKLERKNSGTQKLKKIIRVPDTGSTETELGPQRI
jgi:hypothetical protein